MNIIVSGNEQILRIINEIPVDASNKIEKEKFLNWASEIANGKESNES